MDKAYKKTRKVYKKGLDLTKKTFSDEIIFKKKKLSSFNKKQLKAITTILNRKN